MDDTVSDAYADGGLDVQPSGMLLGHSSTGNSFFAFLRHIEHVPSRYVDWFLLEVEAAQVISFGLHRMYKWGAAVGFVADAVFLSHIPVWDAESVYGLPRTGRVAALWLLCAMTMSVVVAGVYLTLTAPEEQNTFSGLYKHLVFWLGTFLFVPVLQMDVSFLLYAHNDADKDESLNPLHFVGAAVSLAALLSVCCVVTLFHYDPNPKTARTQGRSHATCDLLSLVHKVATCLVLQYCAASGNEAWFAAYLIPSCLLMACAWTFCLPHFLDTVTKWKVVPLVLASAFSAVGTAISGRGDETVVAHETDLAVVFALAVVLVPLAARLTMVRRSRIFTAKMRRFRYEGVEALPNPDLPNGLFRDEAPWQVDPADDSEKVRSGMTFGYPYIETCVVATDVELATRFMRHFSDGFGLPADAKMNEYSNRIFVRGAATFPRSASVLLSQACHLIYRKKRFEMARVLLERVAVMDCTIVERYQAHNLSQKLRTDSSELLRYKQALHHHRSCLQKRLDFWTTLGTSGEVDTHAIDSCAQVIEEESRAGLSEYLAALRLEDKDKQIHRSNIRMMIHYGMFFDQVQMNGDLASRCFTVAQELLKARGTRAMAGAKKGGGGEDNIENIPTRDEVQNLGGNTEGSKRSGRHSILEASQMLCSVVALLLVLLAAFVGLRVVVASNSQALISSVSTVGRAHSALLHAAASIHEVGTARAPYLNAGERAARAAALPGVYSKLSDLADAFHTNLKLATVGADAPSHDSVTMLIKTPYLYSTEDAPHAAFLGTQGAFYSVWTSGFRAAELLLNFVSQGPDNLPETDPTLAYAKAHVVGGLSAGLNHSAASFQEWNDANTRLGQVVVCVLYAVCVVFLAVVFIGIRLKFRGVEVAKQMIRDVVKRIPSETVEECSAAAQAALRRFDHYQSKPEGLISREISPEIQKSMDGDDDDDVGLLGAEAITEPGANDAATKQADSVGDSAAEEESEITTTLEDAKHGSTKATCACVLLAAVASAVLAGTQLSLADTLDGTNHDLPRHVSRAAISLLHMRSAAVRFTIDPYDAASYGAFLERATELALTDDLAASTQVMLLDKGFEELVRPVALGFKDAHNVVYQHTIAMRMAYEGALSDQKAGRAVPFGRTPLLDTDYEMLRATLWTGARLPVFVAKPELPRKEAIVLKGTALDTAGPGTWDLGVRYILSQAVAGRAENFGEFWTGVVGKEVSHLEEGEYSDVVGRARRFLVGEIVLLCLSFLALAQVFASAKQVKVLRGRAPLAVLVAAAVLGCVTAVAAGAASGLLEDAQDRDAAARACAALVDVVELRLTRALHETQAFALRGEPYNQGRYWEQRTALLQARPEYLGLGEEDETAAALTAAWRRVESVVVICDTACVVSQYAFNISALYMEGDRNATWDAAEVVEGLSHNHKTPFATLEHRFSNDTHDVAHAARGHLRQSSVDLVTASFITEVVGEAVQAVRAAAAATGACKGDTDNLLTSAKHSGAARMTLAGVAAFAALFLLVMLVRSGGGNGRGGGGAGGKTPALKHRGDRGVALQVRVAAALLVVLMMITVAFVLVYVTSSSSGDSISNIDVAASREWISATAMLLASELKADTLSHGASDPGTGYRRLLVAFQANLAALRAAHRDLYFGSVRDSGFLGVAASATQDALLFHEAQSIPQRYIGACSAVLNADVVRGLKYGLNSAVERWIALQQELSTTTAGETTTIVPLVRAMEAQFPPLMDALAYSTNLYTDHAKKRVAEDTTWVLMVAIIVACLVIINFAAMFGPVIGGLLRDDLTTTQILRLVPQAVLELGPAEEDMDNAGTVDTQVPDEVLQMSPYPLISIDHNGIILKFSKGPVKEQFGHSALELIGANISVLMAERYARNHDKYLANYRRTGIKHVIDKVRTVSALRKNGKEFPCEVTVRQFKCAGNDVFLGAIRSLRHDLYLQSVTRRNTKIRDMNLDGVIVIDIVGTVLEVNPAANKIFEWDGRSRDSTLVGQNVKVLMPHEVATHHDDYLANYRKTGVKRMVSNIRRATGQRRSGEAVLLETKIEEVATTPPAYVGYIRDMSLVEKFEEEFKMSDAIANLSPLAVVSIDEMGRILRFSSAAEKLFGCTEGSVQKKNVKMLMPLAVSSLHDDYLATYRATRVRHIVGSTREAEARKLDGTVFPVRVGVQEVEHSLVPTFVGFIEDRTEQNEVATQERIISAVTYTSPNGIITADEVGTVLSANMKVLELWGFKKEEDIVGKNVKLLMPDRYADEHDSILETYARTQVKHLIGTSRQAEAMRCNGEEFPVIIRVVEIKTERKTTFLAFLSSAEVQLDLERGKQVNRAALGVTTEAVIVINSFGLITQFSPSAEEVFGYKEDEVTGQNVRLLCPPAIARKHDGFLLAYAKTGKKYMVDATRELTGMTRAGVEVTVSTRISEYLVDGQPVFVGFISDNRERDKLASVDAYVEELDRTISLPMIRIKPTSQVLFINKMALDVFGFTSGEVLGQNINILMKQSFRIEHDGILARHRREPSDGVSLRQPKRVVGQRKDGTPVYLELSLASIVQQNEAGVPQETLVALMQDISKLVELESSTKNVDKITNLSSTAVLVIDSSGKLLSFSRSAEQLFGRKADTVLGKKINMLMAEPHRTQHDRYLDTYKKYGEKHVIDSETVVRARHKNGSDLHIRLTVTETSTKTGSVYTGFAEDMTLMFRTDLLVKQNKSVMQLSDFPTVMMNKTGTIKSLNTSLLKTFDYARDTDLIGQNIKMLMPDEVARKHDGYLKAYRETGVKKVIGTIQHLEGKTSNGELFGVELRVEEAENNADVLLMGCIRDKRPEQENEKLARMTQVTIDFCEPIVMMDRHCVVQLFSKQACEVYGYTSDEVVGKNVKMLIYDEDIRDRHDDIIKSYLATGKKVALVQRMSVSGLRKDGRELRLFSVIKESVINNEVCFFACLQDGEAELAFCEENSMSEAVQQYSSLPMVSVSSACLVTRFNEAAEQLFAFSADAIIGQNVKVLMPPEVAEKHDGYIAAYLKTGKKTVIDNQVELQITTANGSTLPIELSVREVDAGNELSFIAYARNLSGDKEAEYQQTMTQTIIQQSPAPIILMGVTGIILQFNHAGEQEFGYTADEVVTKNVSMLMPDEHAERHDEYLKRYQVTGVRKVIGTTTTSLKAMRKNGEEFPMALTVMEVNKEGMEPLFIGCLKEYSKELGLQDQVDVGQAMLQASLTPLITMTATGSITGFSDSAHTLFGYGREEVLDENVKMLMPQETADQHDGYLRRYLETREKRVVDIPRCVVAQHKSGARLDVEIFVSEVVLDGVSTYSGYVHDLAIPRALEWEGKLSDLLMHMQQEP